jgi:uncharacterized protein YcbX
VQIEHLYRYPVKGLTAEALEEVMVEPGEGLPWDRAFALAQGDAPFDPAEPIWLKKTHFMCLMANARIAAFRSAYDPASGLLSVRGPDGRLANEDVRTADGRARMGAFLAALLGEEARGTPRFHHVPGHSFQDGRIKAVSLINLGSLAAYERDVGGKRDLMRFRANIYFTGPAWVEFDWIGQDVTIGGAVLRVVKRTVRCPATEVNPATAERDADPVKELFALYGHRDLGVHAEVVDGGRIAVGDAILPGF